MTNEEKTIKLAEACGWTGCYASDRFVTGIDAGGIERDLPDYFGSRDAILPEIASLTKPQMSRFGHKLMERTGHWCCGVVPNFEDDCRDLTMLVLSPPDVLAETLGITLGLWTAED